MRNVSVMGAVLVALATASVAHADAAPATFARCAICHNAEKGAPDKLGPNLWGVYGTVAGTHGTFVYSKALKASHLKLDEAGLDKWIENPMATVPGTMMSFPGIKDPAKRKELIEYLKKQR